MRVLKFAVAVMLEVIVVMMGTVVVVVTMLATQAVGMVVVIVVVTMVLVIVVVVKMVVEEMGLMGTEVVGMGNGGRGAACATTNQTRPIVCTRDRG